MINFLQLKQLNCLTQKVAGVELYVFYTFLSYCLCLKIMQCAFGNHSLWEARKSKYMKIYLMKNGQIKKVAAGFVEFLNVISKYEKKLL